MSENVLSPEVSAAIEKLSAYGFDLIDQPEALKVLFDWGQLPLPPLTVHLGGLSNWGHEIEPLRVQVRHDEAKTLIFEDDPIGAIIESHMPSDMSDPYEDDEKADVDRAIAALQSGIDRLRAYETERLQAQP